jgi:hypothetical protein
MCCPEYPTGPQAPDITCGQVEIGLSNGDTLPAFRCEPSTLSAPAVLIVHDADGPRRFTSHLRDEWRAPRLSRSCPIERENLATVTFCGFPDGRLQGADLDPLQLANRMQGPLVGFFGAQDKAVRG